jgi:hypothetical protein
MDKKYDAQWDSLLIGDWRLAIGDWRLPIGDCRLRIVRLAIE